jgi:hypothetical protein
MVAVAFGRRSWGTKWSHTKTKSNEKASRGMDVFNAPSDLPRSRDSSNPIHATVHGQVGGVLPQDGNTRPWQCPLPPFSPSRSHATVHVQVCGAGPCCGFFPFF